MDDFDVFKKAIHDRWHLWPNEEYALIWFEDFQREYEENIMKLYDFVEALDLDSMSSTTKWADI